MEFRILGSVGIADDHGPVSVGGSKPRLLLAVLLAHRNRVVSADALVDALWGEHPPATARTTLSSHMSRLRRQVETAGAGAVKLLASPPGYVLETPDALVDAGRFEKLLEEGRQLLERDPETARRLLEEALATWHGNAFAEFAQEEAVYADAVRLEELRLGCREDRLAAMLSLDLHDDAVSDAEALVTAHPLRERAWSQLMLGLTRGGRPAEALRAAERLRGHLAEIGLEPSSAVRDLEDAILTERPEATWDRTATGAGRRRRPVSANNLPLELTTFIGRTRELDDLVALMGRQRLVTLSGVGGVGKSRLALQVAQRLLPAAPDGVFLVELAAIRDPSLIVPTIARALHLAELPGRPVAEAVDEHLARHHLVLVIDNCEHLAAEIAELISHLLRTGPDVRVLATSRVRLGVEGEAVWPVPILALPGVADPDAAASDAVALFADRARLSDAAFVLDDSVLPVVERICRRVEGIPLAIELAAARLGVLTAPQVESRLDDLGALLATHGSADPRHHTMRATLDWSFDLLDPGAQTLLRRMSVFHGGFDLEAAEGVAGFDPLPSGQILDALHRLIDASLVARSRDSGRYRLLEPVRQFAVEKLRQAGEAEETAGRHARHFAALVAEAHEQLRGADQERWFARLDADRDNLALALSLALDHDQRTALAMGSGLGGFWVDRGHHTEARRWVRDLTRLIEGGDSAEMGHILLIASQLAGFEGDHEQATALADRADEIGLAVRDPWLSAQSTLRRAGLAWDYGRTGDAVPLYEDAVNRLNLLGSPSVTYALSDLGLMLGFMGAFAQAEAVGEALRRAADRFRQPDGHAMLLDHLAVLSMYQGDAETAWKHIELVIPERRRLGVRTFLVNSLRRLMWPAIELGRFDRARAVFQEGMEISREMGYRAGEAGLLIVAARLHLATGEVDRARAVLIEGLQLLGGVRRADWTMFGLFESGRVALLSGKAEVAAKLHGASAGIREHSPLVLLICQQNELERDLPELDRRLGREGRERAWQAGAAMPAVDAGRLALGMLRRGPMEPAPHEPDAPTAAVAEPVSPRVG